MSIAAENVLGGIILGGKEAFYAVADLLRAEDFARPADANLYALLVEMADDEGEIDIVTVAEEASRRGVASTSRVSELSNATASFANIRGWAERVREDATSRRFRAICAEGARTGDMAATQAALAGLQTEQPTRGVAIREALKDFWDDVMARYHAGDEIAGLSTGFPLLDEMTGGLQPGRVYGIGARAKMGKTVFAMNVCTNVAMSGKPVRIFSLEMTAKELSGRILSSVAGAPSYLLARPKLFDERNEELARYTAAMRPLHKVPLSISDKMDVTIEQVEAEARQAHAAGELDLLCIDYLGLLRAPKADRHDLAVAHNTRRVKIIAKELQIPVLLVFQLNRGSESGQLVRAPRPSDARDSGAIEQDVDAMFLLHRPSYYDKAAPKGLRFDVAIQRNGPTGLIHMRDELECFRFTGGADEWVDGAATVGGRDDDL